MADSHGNSKTTKLPIRFATPQEDAANLPNTEVHDTRRHCRKITNPVG
jgi:hypothetical protein